jgi:hypothetical protein
MAVLDAEALSACLGQTIDDPEEGIHIPLSDLASNARPSHAAKLNLLCRNISRVFPRHSFQLTWICGLQSYLTGFLNWWA